MVFDKIKVLIEHQDNELFSVFASEDDKDWVRVYSDLEFNNAKYLVKIIKVAYKINQDLQIPFVGFCDINRVDEIVEKNNLSQRTALKIYTRVKKINDAAGSL